MIDRAVNLINEQFAIDLHSKIIFYDQSQVFVRYGVDIK